MNIINRHRFLAAIGHIGILALWLVIARNVSDGEVLWLIAYAGIAAGAWSVLGTPRARRFSITLAFLQPLVIAGIIVIIVSLKSHPVDPRYPREPRSGEGLPLFVMIGIFFSLISIGLSVFLVGGCASLWRRFRAQSK